MHIHHTIGMSEVAGFAAIEIEDQILPKRAHQPSGLSMVPLELMVAKVREAVKARRDPDFVIIARTNGIRGPGGMADAIKRARAYREAGADMLYLSVRNADEAKQVARELPPPFMFGLGGHGTQGAGLPLAELGALGYRILASSISAWAFHRAMKQSYECPRGEPDPDGRHHAQGRAACAARDHRHGAHAGRGARHRRKVNKPGPFFLHTTEPAIWHVATCRAGPRLFGFDLGGLMTRAHLSPS